jgi:hypothetical protein
MSKILNTATAMIVIGLAATGVAQAAPESLHGYYAHEGYAAPLPAYGAVQQPQTPQFNNTGPQLSIPQPDNAVEQLSPLPGTAGQPDALGIR